MSLLEQVQGLTCTFDMDDNYIELKNALEEYHELVKEGVLTPRENNIPNGYVTFFQNSDMNYKQPKN